MGYVSKASGRQAAGSGAAGGAAPGAATADPAGAGARGGVPERPTIASPVFYNPFTDPMAGRPRPAPAPPRASRRLANGAALTLVASAGPDEPVTPASTPEDTRAPEPAPVEAPAAASPSRTGGGGGGSGSGGGGSGGGSGPVEPANERAFGRDDVVGAVAALTGLLLIALIAFPRGGGGDAGDPVVTPASVSAPAPVPEPAPDPFGAGPVDLTPDSPIPEPAPAPPPPVEAVTPEPVCTLDRKVQALFCTDRDELALPARDALDAAINDWRACIRDKPLVVTGYADTRGPKEYNIDLAARRARSIASILRSEGMSVAEAIGFGELDGIEDNRNCPNQRRVDIGFREALADPPSRDCRPPTELEKLICP